MMNMSDWNVFDWVLVSIVVISIVRAFITGLVRAIAGLLGFLVGYEVAAWTYLYLADRFRERGWIMSQPMARTAAFLLIVVFVVVLFDVLGRLMRNSLRTIGMGTFDRILGAGFGFARGCLIGLSLLIAMSSFAPQSPIIFRSVLRPYLFTIAHEVSFLIPDYLQQRIL
jgi:membrane protein required for colicin V production